VPLSSFAEVTLTTELPMRALSPTFFPRRILKYLFHLSFSYLPLFFLLVNRDNFLFD